MKGLTSCFISPITKVFLVMKGSPTGGPFVVYMGAGENEPVLVAEWTSTGCQ